MIFEADTANGSCGSGEPPKKHQHEMRLFARVVETSVSAVQRGASSSRLWEAFWQKRQSKLHP
jgi:hypothetical protein